MSDAARITTILTILMCDGWLGSLPGCAAVKVVNADDGALSRFAHFEAATNAGATAGVKACLGDTFATGLAAQVVAQKLDRVCQ